MKRNDFLKMFNPLNVNSENIYQEDVHLDYKGTYTEVLNVFKDNFPVNTDENNEFLFKIFPDWMFMEDNPEIDGWRYNVEVNLNELYDSYSSKENNNLVKIYRLCNEDGDGIYAMGLGYKFLESGMSPHEDNALKSIFPSFSKRTTYSEKWQFGFKDLEQLKVWLNNPNIIIEMKSRGLGIAEIEISENFVIEGIEQVIYKKDNVKNVVFKPLEDLYKNPVPVSKFRM